ncbi:TetR family transcriptional regulator [Phenylobacterium sp.]|uniref:TetR/AcrR family transcriptional regulator n=1 Tax=Phenylobacterium sp. TaxID=1871053 RepID=UPI0028982682|nr:TetR family transcriptional regulator [Phenylobacterium sp.]
MTEVAPRPRGRPAKDARSVEATRAAILAAALTLFSERGFEGVALRDIAAAAGVEHSLVRYHFTDKATLWRAALRNLVDQMNAERRVLWRATYGQPLLERFKQALRDYVRYCARHPEHARIMVHETMTDTDRTAWIAEHIVVPQHRAGRRNIEALMAAGHLPRMEPRRLIYMMAAASQAPFTLAGELRLAYGVDPMTPQEVEAHADAVIATFVRA